MEVKILVNEKNTLEMELGDTDVSLAQLLAEKLNEEKDVEFASYKLEHPLVGSPKLFVRTKKGEPAKLVLEKLEEIKKEVADFRDQFKEIVK
ncbi:MAG TPA: RpoL/Rpb11 RNA polymerase subunit family protein [Candidatus Bilamarchaeum sp.]|nr:RpoL/Rpb11 RNA polymerase subunit family protein [Candidatus Bilamarchaeum sp.]